MHHLRILLLAIFTSFTLTSEAHCAHRVRIVNEGSRASVEINGKRAIAFRTSYRGLAPSQRAGVAVQRILQALENGQPVSKITVAKERRFSSVQWLGSTITYVTREEARAHASKPSALAEAWASNLRKSLSIPPVLLSPREVVVPFGEQRRIRQAGYADGPFSVTVQPQGLVQATADEKGNIVVNASQTGSGILTLTTAEGSDKIPISVRKYAGRITQPPVALVTGTTVPSDVVAEAVTRSVRSVCQLESGASVFVSLVSKPKQMGANIQALGVPVSVKIAGPGYLTAQLNPTVTVQKAPYVSKPAEILFYSNHPEQVLRPQPLYSAPMPANQTARLLYHHQNGSGQKLRVSVILCNVDERPADIHITGAIAEPRMDTVLVGYRAGSQFLKDLTQGVGYVLQAPGNSRCIIWSGVLDKMETASGIIEMRQLSDAGNIIVRVLAEPASVYRTAQDITSIQQSDISSVYSGHQYPAPFRQLNESYDAGGRWLFIRVGKHAIADASTQRKLDGNYGVIYDINLTINNPTAIEKNVSVVFDATAGTAGVASMIDGRYYGKSHVDPSDEICLAKYKLAPGQKKQVRFSTVPLAGSNYPATIVVRS